MTRLHSSTEIFSVTAMDHRGRIARFIGTGIVNTGFGYAIFAFALWMGAAAQVALLFQFVLGVLWNYLLHARFVFGVKGSARLPWYALAYSLVYALNAWMLAGLLAAGLGPYLAQALAMPFIVVLSYIAVAMALQAPLRRGRGQSHD